MKSNKKVCRSDTLAASPQLKGKTLLPTNFYSFFQFYLYPFFDFEH